MRREIIVAIGIVGVVVIVIFGLFNDGRSADVGSGILHEIRTFDAWKQSGFTSPGLCQYPQGNFMSVAFPAAPVIMKGDAPPQLIEELGVEVVSVSGGKVKITGVMGNSWAEKAGLKRNDIILRFNKKKIKSLQHFKTLINQVSPERDYRIKVLRGGRVKSFLVTIGEGEMEGFTPIAPVAFTNPIAVHGSRGYYQCPRCGNCLMVNNAGALIGQNCPLCRFSMRRIR